MHIYTYIPISLFSSDVQVIFPARYKFQRKCPFGRPSAAHPPPTVRRARPPRSSSSLPGLLLLT